MTDATGTPGTVAARAVEYLGATGLAPIPRLVDAILQDGPTTDRTQIERGLGTALGFGLIGLSADQAALLPPGQQLLDATKRSQVQARRLAEAIAAIGEAASRVGTVLSDEMWDAALARWRDFQRARLSQRNGNDSRRTCKH